MSGKNGDGPHYSSWLVVRYQAGDGGDRPLAPGAVFWESPDVWTQGSRGKNQPVVGEPTQVMAQINNAGQSDAVGVTIKFYWADPSLAIVEDPTKLIGEITGETIPAQNSLQYQCPMPWIPTEVNNGHECLVVEAYIPVFDPLSDPMHPADDRHVGQKNEQLVTLEAGQSLHFRLSAINIAHRTEEITIEVRPGVIPRNFTRRFGRPGMWPMELMDPTSPLPAAIHIAKAPERVITPPRSAERRLRGGAGRSDMNCLAPPQAAASHRFEPGEVRAVTISATLPPSAQPGEIYVNRIVQRIGQVIVGGYTLYLTLADAHRR